MKRIIFAGMILFPALLLIVTMASLSPVPESLLMGSEVKRLQLFDRLGLPLSVTYQNDLNLTDIRRLEQIPSFLQNAFLLSEDKRFYRHHGVDWTARLHAVWQNIAALRVERGASTITEQVIRILNPRPRTFWSRWVEGFDAGRLEKKFSKSGILEFYLNQVPYARNMRGIVQAARYYFDRDLETLSKKEMLLLAAVVRAPARFDRNVESEGVEKSVVGLGERMLESGYLSAYDLAQIKREKISVLHPQLSLPADHFVRYVLSNAESGTASKLTTTLDGSLQLRAQALLEARIRDLSDQGVTDGALLAADHRTGEILAWVNAGDFDSNLPGSKIDAVITPRQPGSALKPFLYALALTKGWTASTIIDDSPITHPVGRGLHLYRNYSRINYGPVRLRVALGNSLNIPAVKTIMFTGKDDFIDFLHKFGFRSLSLHPDFYGEGLALGNGEVTLLELVQGYAALAEGGVFSPLIYALGANRPQTPVVSPEVSSIISDILSDPQARRLEFGGSDLLQFPVETAVKTGTSSDYNDAWAVGYSGRYVAGVWLGNLDRHPMHEVSGAVGPALILRALFAELEKRGDSTPIRRSKNLTERKICADSGKLAQPSCPTVTELFVPGSEPIEGLKLGVGSAAAPAEPPKIGLPTPGLRIALDPRIPDRDERFPFRLNDSNQKLEAEWWLDGELIGTGRGSYLWQPIRGEHQLKARVRDFGGEIKETAPVNFTVR